MSIDATSLPLSAAPGASREPAFVAVNFIACTPEYRPRFETLFASRAHAIDGAPGFLEMRVLRPDREGSEYLVVSHWSDRAAFDAWRTSPAFLEGHRRAFEDLKVAREAGQPAPMTSRFETYDVVCR